MEWGGLSTYDLSRVRYPSDIHPHIWRSNSTSITQWNEAASIRPCRRETKLNYVLEWGGLWHLTSLEWHSLQYLPSHVKKQISLNHTQKQGELPLSNFTIEKQTGLYVLEWGGLLTSNLFKVGWTSDILPHIWRSKQYSIIYWNVAAFLYLTSS